MRTSGRDWKEVLQTQTAGLECGTATETKGWMRNEVPGRARNQPDWGEYRHSGPPYPKGTWSRTPSGRLSPRGLPGHFPNLPSCDTGSPIKQAQYEINDSDNKTERL